MPIDFPNSPVDNQLHPDPSGGAPQWQFDSATNSWTMITAGTIGLENGTNLDNTVVNLNRVGSLNIQAPATGLEFNPDTRNLKVKALSSQAVNMVSLVSNTDTILNGFNQRGVLLNAGMVFHSGSQPSVNNADLGQLWYNTSSGAIHAWTDRLGAPAWQVVGSGVTLDSNQIIDGAKTFRNSIILQNNTSPVTNSKIIGNGASKSIVLGPSNASSVATDVATFAHNNISFTAPLDVTAIGTTGKTIICTLADAQTITGLKTLTSNLKLATGSAGQTSRIFCDSSTLGTGASDNLVLQTNLSTSGRSISIFNNSDSSDANGIIIRPKNADNVGKLNVVGAAAIQGPLSATGRITSTQPIFAISTTMGSLKVSGSGTPSVAPTNIGSMTDPTNSITFALDESNPSFDEHAIIVTNNTTATVKMYVRREQVRADSSNQYTYGVRLLTIPSGAQFKQKATSGVPVNLVDTTTSVVIGNSGLDISLASGAQNPCTFTFTLAI
jgi:hypothetical protein